MSESRMLRLSILITDAIVSWGYDAEIRKPDRNSSYLRVRVWRYLGGEDWEDIGYVAVDAKGFDLHRIKEEERSEIRTALEKARVKRTPIGIRSYFHAAED